MDYGIKSSPAANKLAKAGASLKSDMRALEKNSPPPNSPVSFAAKLSTIQLYEIERMAMQGMNLAQIAVRLHIPSETWKLIIQANPAVREAYEAGAVRGVDEVSRALVAAATTGDVGAQRYYLDRLGGPQWKPPAATPTVVIHSGAATVVDVAEVENQFERQKALLDGAFDAEYETIEVQEKGASAEANAPVQTGERSEGDSLVD